MTPELTNRADTPNHSDHGPAPDRSALREFVDSNVLGGVLLLTAAVVALLWSNSGLAPLYFGLLERPITLGVGEVSLTLSVQHWVNDALMAVFFLVVGLEIKRELLIGELDSVRRATLPAAAAIGGAALPALIFLVVVGPAHPAARGWGVPMATDIAFALGALALVGRSAPVGLRVFVTALAIVDDLVAVLVIALFYTGELSVLGLLAGAVIFAILLILNQIGVRSLLPYAGLGVALWLAVHESGVHSTVAGVLLALTIPGPRPATQHASAPLVRLEHALNGISGFVIVPLFALANAGVRLDGDVAAIVGDPLVLALVAALILGKQIGITASAWLVVRARLAALPDGVGWAHIYGASWICGIGFTMSLFIAALAYSGTEQLPLAKTGVLLASVVAGSVGYAILRSISVRASSK